MGEEARHLTNRMHARVQSVLMVACLRLSAAQNFANQVENCGLFCAITSGYTNVMNELTDMMTEFADANIHTNRQRLDDSLSQQASGKANLKMLQQFADIQRRRIGKIITQVSKAFGLSSTPLLAVIGSAPRAQLMW